MSLKIQEYRGKGLSKFRTLNCAKHYAEIKSESDIAEAFEYAKKHNLCSFVLGAGSNVFFKRANIKSFVLKNALEKNVRQLSENRFEVSSSVLMIDLLRHLYSLSLEAPYYLASAPCEIGGALAMNAGTGPKEGKAIFDFVESIKFFRDGKIENLPADKIKHSHRNTELSKDAFIISAVFNFPNGKFNSDPVKARLDWAVKNQDLSIPNCGSLCNKYNASIMKFTRFLFRPFPAGMSQKKLNWTYNKANNPIYLRVFLFTLKIVHKLLGKELKFEIKMVD